MINAPAWEWIVFGLTVFGSVMLGIWLFWKG
jgi:hypothetical protein